MGIVFLEAASDGPTGDTISLVKAFSVRETLGNLVAIGINFISADIANIMVYFALANAETSKVSAILLVEVVSVWLVNLTGALRYRSSQPVLHPKNRATRSFERSRRATYSESFLCLCFMTAEIYRASH